MPERPSNTSYLPVWAAKTFFLTISDTLVATNLNFVPFNMVSQRSPARVGYATPTHPVSSPSLCADGPTRRARLHIMAHHHELCALVRPKKSRLCAKIVVCAEKKWLAHTPTPVSLLAHVCDGQSFRSKNPIFGAHAYLSVIIDVVVTLSYELGGGRNRARRLLGGGRNWARRCTHT